MIETKILDELNKLNGVKIIYNDKKQKPTNISAEFLIEYQSKLFCILISNKPTSKNICYELGRIELLKVKYDIVYSIVLFTEIPKYKNIGNVDFGFYNETDIVIREAYLSPTEAIRAFLQ